MRTVTTTRKICGSWSSVQDRVLLCIGGMNEPNHHDPMAAVRPGILLKKQAEEARIEAARLKAEYDAAQEVLASFTDEKLRDEIRAQARRAELIGNLFLFLCHDNPTMWTDFQPHLDRMLETATDKDRKLFGLPELRPKKSVLTDQESASKAATSSGKAGSKSKPDPGAKQGEKPPEPVADKKPEEQPVDS